MIYLALLENNNMYIQYKMFYFYRYNFDSVFFFPIQVSFLLYLHKRSVYLIEGAF